MNEKSLIYWQKKVFQLLFVCLCLMLAFILFKVGVIFQGIVISFIVALLISYLFAKPVDFITKYLKIRVLSILLLYLTVINGLTVIIAVIAPVVEEQLVALKKAMPKIQIKLEAMMISLDKFLQSKNINVPDDIHNLLMNFNQNNLFTSIASAFGKWDINELGSFAGSILLGSVNVFAYTIVTFVISFYLLLDGKSIWKSFLAPFSKKFAQHLQEIKNRVDIVVNSYILGQVQLASLTATVMLITYLSLGIPYAVVLGIVQLLEIIPLVGTWVAITASISIVALTAGPTKATIALVIYLIYTQVIRDYFLAPRVMGSALGFHPIAIIFALIIGAKLGGALGVIICLPIVAAFAEIFGYFIELSRLKVHKI